MTTAVCVCTSCPEIKGVSRRERLSWMPLSRPRSFLSLSLSCFVLDDLLPSASAVCECVSCVCVYVCVGTTSIPFLEVDYTRYLVAHLPVEVMLEIGNSSLVRGFIFFE